jgi:uncharacterized protein YxeA
MKKILILLFLIFLLIYTSLALADKRIVPGTDALLLTTRQELKIRDTALMGNGNSKIGDGGTNNYVRILSDGDMIFVGSAGLPYAQIYEEDGSSTLALPAQDTYYQITAFSDNGESNNATPDHTNDHITVLYDGVYFASFYVSFSQTTAVSVEYDFHIQKNNGATDFPNTSGHRDTAGSQVVGSVSGGGYIQLQANDTVELWVERLSGGGVSRTITIIMASLCVTQVGGISAVSTENVVYAGENVVYAGEQVVYP